MSDDHLEYSDYKREDGLTAADQKSSHLVPRR